MHLLMEAVNINHQSKYREGPNTSIQSKYRDGLAYFVLSLTCSDVEKCDVREMKIYRYYKYFQVYIRVKSSKEKNNHQHFTP